MAETENGWLAQGRKALSIPIFEWQDHDVHLEVMTEFMAGPDYQKLPPEVQQEFVTHYNATRQAAVVAFQNQLRIEAQRRLLAGGAAQDVELGLQERIGAAGGQPSGSPPPGASQPGGNEPGQPAKPSAVA